MIDLRKELWKCFLCNLSLDAKLIELHLVVGQIYEKNEKLLIRWHLCLLPNPIIFCFPLLIIPQIHSLC